MNNVSMQSVSIIIFIIATFVAFGVIFYYGPDITTSKIPMQWGVDGQPTWYGPRLLGLWLIPCILLAIGLLMIMLAHFGAGSISYGLILMSLTLAGAQWWHLNAIVKWISKQ